MKIAENVFFLPQTTHNLRVSGSDHSQELSIFIIDQLFCPNKIWEKANGLYYLTNFHFAIVYGREKAKKKFLTFDKLE